MSTPMQYTNKEKDWFHIINSRENGKSLIDFLKTTENSKELQNECKISDVDNIKSLKINVRGNHLAFNQSAAWLNQIIDNHHMSSLRITLFNTHNSLVTFPNFSTNNLHKDDMENYPGNSSQYKSKRSPLIMKKKFNELIADLDELVVWKLFPHVDDLFANLPISGVAFLLTQKNKLRLPVFINNLYYSYKIQMCF